MSESINKWTFETSKGVDILSLQWSDGQKLNAAVAHNSAPVNTSMCVLLKPLLW